MNEWIFVVDSRNKIRWISDDPLPPRRREDFINRRMAADLPEEQRAVAYNALDTLRRTGKTQRYDVLVPPEQLWWRVVIRTFRLPNWVHGVAKPWPIKVRQLTAAQQQVCVLLARGMSSKGIAHELGKSRTSIDNHRAKIAAKLCLKPHCLMAWCGEHVEWLG